MTTSTPPATTPEAGDRPRRVTPSDLDELVASSSVRVVDVRTPAEFESVHIPGSYNVPLDTLREHRDELLHHLDEEIVLVCRSGQRARQAERALADGGLPNLRVLDGGMSSWQSDGRRVRRGRQRWDLERQVRLVAGSIVLASVVVSAAVPGAQIVAGLVGGGLAAAALTNSCLLGSLLARLPYNRGAQYDVGDVVRQLAADGGGRGPRDRRS